MKSLLLLFLFIIGSFVIASDKLTIEKINKNIKAQNKSWIAGSNPIWNLTDLEKRRLNGAISGKVDSFLFYGPGTKDFDFPPVLDWRNRDGFNYLTPVKDQAHCGSCVAFATIAAYEAQRNIANGWPDLNIDFSEQYLFSCGSGSCEMGWYNNKALRFLKNEGVADEGCMVYESGGDGGSRACSTRCGDYRDRLTKIDGYSQITGKDSSSIMSMIEALQNGPLIAFMKTFQDFAGYEGGIYEHTTNDSYGGKHAIAVVGYNYPERYWIVKNSWGDDWGEDGYFRIRMGDPSGIEVETFSIHLNSPDGTTKIEAPKRKEVIHGAYEIKLHSSVPGTIKMQLEIISKSGQRMVLDAARSKTRHEYALNFDSKTLPDGVYRSHAVAYLEGGRTFKSVAQRLLIQNSEPEMRLKITKPRNGATLRVRSELEFELKSTPVPVMKMNFVYKDSNGVINKVPNNYPTRDIMMVWNTLTVENGDYEIWIEGEIGRFKKESKHLKVRVYNWNP